MEDNRRGRRFRRPHVTPTLLPIRAPTPTPVSLSNTISCWYCDYKISALNGPLFRFGRRHAKALRVWFSIGVGFSLTALLGVTMILIWDLGKSLHLFSGSTNLSSSLLFGFSPGVYGLRLSLGDAAYLLFSTLVSVSVHEFGHAIAAASEGIQIEYIAIFIAVLFPGALVAFNHELLQALRHFTSLRVYCAGIWHNAVCCAVCGLALFLLPLILCPFYIHGKSPMVLDIPSTSPLSGYLSPGDVILSLDGKRIHSGQEWMEMAALIDEQTFQNLNYSKNSEGFAIAHSRKGYCVHTSMIEQGKIQSVDNQSTCSNGLTEFIAIQCFDSRTLDDFSIVDGYPNRKENTHCLNAKDVVKFNKCGDGWLTEGTNGNNCVCSQDESCLSSVQFPGLIWTEITFSSPYSPECLQLGRHYSNSEIVNTAEHSCGGTFVFVGDPISMAHSVQLTAYQPRWPFSFGASLPNVLEKILMCTFHVSLTVALLNSLPVYFLDGESILEVALGHFTLLGPRKRKKVLQASLFGGTLISTLAFLRVFFVNFLSS